MLSALKEFWFLRKVNLAVVQGRETDVALLIHNRYYNNLGYEELGVRVNRMVYAEPLEDVTFAYWLKQSGLSSCDVYMGSNVYVQLGASSRFANTATTPGRIAFGENGEVRICRAKTERMKDLIGNYGAIALKRK